MGVENYTLPVYFQELYDAADEADRPTIYALGILRAAGVKELSYHLDIDKLYCIARFRMLPTIDASEVKSLISTYLQHAWGVKGAIDFSQSRQERYQSTGDVLYFHATFQASIVRARAYAGLT